MITSSDSGRSMLVCIMRLCNIYVGSLAVRRKSGLQSDSVQFPPHFISFPRFLCIMVISGCSEACDPINWPSIVNGYLRTPSVIVPFACKKWNRWGEPGNSMDSPQGRVDLIEKGPSLTSAIWYRKKEAGPFVVFVVGGVGGLGIGPVVNGEGEGGRFWGSFPVCHHDVPGTRWKGANDHGHTHVPPSSDPIPTPHAPSV